MSGRVGARPAARARTVRALAHAFGLGWREVLAQPGAIAGVFLTYAAILALWANLYRLLPARTLASASLGYAQIVWYLALTEAVAFSIGHAYRQIEDEIRDGTVSAHLVRPVGYVALIASQELGRMTAKMAALAACGGVVAYALAGGVPFGVAALPAIAASLCAGAAVLLAAQILIGLSAAWLGTARPVFFIVQKLVFVFGGLLLPLDAYPTALARIAVLTPFSAMLYAPGSLALDASLAHAAETLARQLGWIAAAAVALAAAGDAFERRLVRTGAAS
ncbi:MAG TPA: ABC-2 family transporter protein [Gammaproteobacteria bacterium]|nr:ABC-2 family transporter protein [Gammaproteobacteria bacterium]